MVNSAKEIKKKQKIIKIESIVQPVRELSDKVKRTRS